MKFPLFKNLVNTNYSKNIAICYKGKNYSYHDLFNYSHHFGSFLGNGNSTVAILSPNSIHYVIAQLATWTKLGVSVPLCPMHPPPEWEYALRKSKANIVFAHPEFMEKLSPLQSKLNLDLIPIDISKPILESTEQNEGFEDFEMNSPALVLFTSGTTSKPKAVVHSFKSLSAQCNSIIKTWNILPSDRFLHFMPLHHTHGLVNILLSPLFAGATVEFLETSNKAVMNPDDVWIRLSKPEGPFITQLHTVPKSYSMLLEAFESVDNKTIIQENMKKHIRMCVSGSSALSSQTLEGWNDLFPDNKLIERYGMTETGMITTNPLKNGIAQTVGIPFSGVNVQLRDDGGKIIENYDEPGEIFVKSECLFQMYLGDEKSTKESFTLDGYFITGDIAVKKKANSSFVYQILGRKNVDIIKVKFSLMKHSGYKISSLEIERVLNNFEGIHESVVIGVPHNGDETITAVIVPKDSLIPFKKSPVRTYLGTQLARYKIPSKFIIVKEIPRNVMGKVDKRSLIEKVINNTLGSKS
jgi:malonyl-CoA/methylmalonyl-CoA synthetase